MISSFLLFSLSHLLHPKACPYPLALLLRHSPDTVLSIALVLLRYSPSIGAQDHCWRLDLFSGNQTSTLFCAQRSKNFAPLVFHCLPIPPSQHLEPIATTRTFITRLQGFYNRDNPEAIASTPLLGRLVCCPSLQSSLLSVTSKPALSL